MSGSIHLMESNGRGLAELGGRADDGVCWGKLGTGEMCAGGLGPNVSALLGFCARLSCRIGVKLLKLSHIAFPPSLFFGYLATVLI